MVQPVLNGMITLMLAKLMLNDLPHATGITKGPDYEGPPTSGQLRYIAILSYELKMTIMYEERVRTFGEAGLMITELKAEKAYRRRLKKGNPGNPEPTGTCYPDAWRYVMQHAEKEPVLIHGSTFTISGRLNHAWVELPDGTVWEPASQAIFPKEKFYSLVDPIVDERYTVDEAASMLNVGYHGPWNAEERMEHIGR